MSSISHGSSGTLSHRPSRRSTSRAYTSTSTGKARGASGRRATFASSTDTSPRIDGYASMVARLGDAGYAFLVCASILPAFDGDVLCSRTQGAASADLVLSLFIDHLVSSSTLIPVPSTTVSVAAPEPRGSHLYMNCYNPLYCRHGH